MSKIENIEALKMSCAPFLMCRSLELRARTLKLVFTRLNSRLSVSYLYRATEKIGKHDYKSIMSRVCG